MIFKKIEQMSTIFLLRRNLNDSNQIILRLRTIPTQSSSVALLQNFQFGVLKIHTVNLGIFDWANFEDKDKYLLNPRLIKTIEVFWTSSLNLRKLRSHSWQRGRTYLLYFFGFKFIRCFFLKLQLQTFTWASSQLGWNPTNISPNLTIY